MKLDRRDFVKQAAIGSIGTAIAGNRGLSDTYSTPAFLKGKDDRVVRPGFIGVGGMGSNLLRSCLSVDFQ